MTENPVRFGTDGWRAIMGEAFTFENVRACAQAVAEHFAETRGRGEPLVVGYDTRFQSDEFALAVARVLAGNGFQVQLADRPAPTPALSYRIIEAGAGGGVIVTSSHNPFRWNGIKVKPHYGGSASPEIVADIERRVPAILADAARPKLAPRGLGCDHALRPHPGVPGGAGTAGRPRAHPGGGAAGGGRPDVRGGGGAAVAAARRRRHDRRGDSHGAKPALSGAAGAGANRLQPRRAARAGGGRGLRRGCRERRRRRPGGAGGRVGGVCRPAADVRAAGRSTCWGRGGCGGRS